MEQQSSTRKRKRNTYDIGYAKYNINGYSKNNNNEDSINKLYKMNKMMLEDLMLIKEENKKILKELQLIYKCINNPKQTKPTEDEKYESKPLSVNKDIDTLLNLDKLTFKGECSYIN
jgi:hypothetical protein